MEKENNWFPKSLTSTLLSIILAMLTGIIINLLTISFPNNNTFFILQIIVEVLLVISLIAAFNILKIRLSIEEHFLEKTKSNAEIEAKDRVDPKTLWDYTLVAKKKDQGKYAFYKWVGLVMLILGFSLLSYLSFSIRIDTIDQDNHNKKDLNDIRISIEILQNELKEQNSNIIDLIDTIQNKNNDIENIIKTELNKKNQTKKQE